MNNMNIHWITLSLLIALSAIMVSLSEWQLGFLAIVMLVCFFRRDQWKRRGDREGQSRRQ